MELTMQSKHKIRRSNPLQPLTPDFSRTERLTGEQIIAQAKSRMTPEQLLALGEAKQKAEIERRTQQAEIERLNTVVADQRTEIERQRVVSAKVNPFPERSDTEVKLRAEIRKLNGVINAERKKHAIVEGVFCSQKKLDDQQIADLRKLVFAGIRLVSGERKS